MNSLENGEMSKEKNNSKIWNRFSDFISKDAGQFSHCWDKTPATCNFKEERFVSVYGFKGFSQWSVGTKAETTRWRETQEKAPKSSAVGSTKRGRRKGQEYTLPGQGPTSPSSKEAPPPNSSFIQLWFVQWIHLNNPSLSERFWWTFYI